MEVDFNIPTSLSEMKLNDYQKFLSLSKDSDEAFLMQKMVQIFCNVPLLAVTNMRRKDFNIVSAALLEVLQQKPDLVRTFEHNGKQYGFIPNLDDMTFGEYIDLDNYLKDPKDYHKAMGVLYREVTYKRKDSYLIKDYTPNDGRHFLDVRLDVVIGALLFFYRLGMELLTITPKFLAQKLKKDKRMQVALEKSGVGINTYLQSLEETCLRLMLLLPHTLARP